MEAMGSGDAGRQAETGSPETANQQSTLQAETALWLESSIVDTAV